MRSKTKDRRGRDLVRAAARRLERLRLLAAMMSTQPLMNQQGREINHNAGSGGPAVQPAPVAPAAPPPGPAQSPSASGDAGSTRGADPAPGRDAGVALRLLGAPQLVCGNKSSSLERRAAALLALLVLQGPTPRAHAAALVWPEADETRANNSLRQRIYKLRQAAGRDVIASDRHIALAADITHDLRAPLARLAEDAEACGGELLGELDYTDCGELADWVAMARQRWRAELAHALAELASRQEAEGRIVGALRLAERLVALEPTAEHAHRRVMRLHYLRGDRAAALNAFERCRQVLRSELGVLPDAETQQLQQLIESGAASAPARAAPPQPVSVLRPPRLVGRDAEWQRLQRAIDERHTVLVAGEAGVGKSRLLADFATAHAGLVVSARPGDAGVPYASLARLLRALLAAGAAPAGIARQELARLLPELGPAPEGSFSPLRLRAAVQEVMLALASPPGTQAPHAPRLLALDDAQFADAATLELLPSLTTTRTPTAASSNAVCMAGPHWLLAARPGELPPAIKAWVEAADADALAVLTLRPLSAELVLDLLTSLALPDFDAARWAPALHRHTGGNPMFVLETLRSLMQHGVPGGDRALASEVPAALPLPEDVGSLIERRLAQLSAEALDLARVAALAGQDFTPELAAQVLERRVIDLAEPWRELEAAHVIRDQAFAHDLVLEAVQRSVPEAVASALHRALAGRLQAAAAPPGRVGEHWQLGREPEAACTAFLAAAAAARSASRIDEERFWLERSLACLAESDRKQQWCQVLYAAAIADFELGRRNDFRQRVSQLEASAVAPSDRLLALDARIMQQGEDFEHETKLATLAEAEVLAAAYGTAHQQTRLSELKAISLAFLGRNDEAVQALQFGFDWIEREPDHPWVSGFLLDAAATMSYVERYRDSSALAHRARGVAERHGVVRHVHMALATIGMIDYLLADIESSATAYERSGALAMRFGGDSLQTWTHGCSLAFCLRILGRFSEGLAHAQAHVQRCRESGVSEWWLAWGELELVRTWFELGQHARALATLGDHAPANDDARFRWLLVRCRVDTGADRAERRRWLDELVRLAEGGLRPTGKRWTMAHLLCEALPIDEALAMTRQTTAACRAAGALIYMPPIQMRMAQVLLRESRVGEALALAEELATDTAGRDPHGMYLPEAWWIQHQVFAAAERPAQAHAALAAAQDWILHKALPTVPEPFRESFLHRNEVNRTVLAAASRKGMTPPLQRSRQ